MIFDWLVDAGVLLEVDARNYMSQYAEDTLGDITHATRERAGFTENFIDLRWHGGFTFDITQLQADSLNEAVPCDDDLPEHIQVFCDRAQPFRPGTYAFVGAFFEGLMDTEQVPLIIDAVVFETDGNADNNWQAQPGFMDDSYQGTDRWLEVFRSANARQLVATRTNDDGEVDQRGNTMTSGRVILADDTIMMRREVGWIIPFEEVSLNYRVVAVGSSTGDFEPENSGHDYSGTLTDLSPLLPCGGMCEAP